MIQYVGMGSLVSQKIIDEEACREKMCECCRENESSLLMAQSRGIAIILDHVCERCLKDITGLIHCEEGRDSVRVAVFLKNKSQFIK